MHKTVMLFSLALLAAGIALAQPPHASDGGSWQKDFHPDKANLGPTGVNPYFRLEPGWRMYYQAGSHSDTVTVLPKTKLIDGVEARVVEDRESEKGRLTELTYDYFAIDRTTKDVYYFGEDVDEYKGGKVIGHGGSWLSGSKGAHFGLMMPGKPEVGQRFYEELAPGVGQDRAEVISESGHISTPYGIFDHCLVIRETSPLEPGSVETKYYASGVGLVKDPDFPLVKVTRDQRD